MLITAIKKTITAMRNGVANTADFIVIILAMKLLTLFFFISLPSFLFCEQEIDITSDKMVYDKLNDNVVFTGNVKLKIDDVFLNCEKATADIAKKNVSLDKCFFTTCNCEHPHYHYYAKNVHIVEKKISIRNVFFYVGDVPLAVFPYYYYKSHQEKKLKIDFRPGYNKSEGYFSKGFVGYRFSSPTNHFFSKVYLDYYSYKGFGYGFEEIYSVDNKMQGSVYGYRIKEHNTKTIRWNARIYHLQNLTNTLSLRINSNFASDESFNGYHTRDWIRIYRDVNSSVTLTRNTGVSTTRILFSRNDIFNTDNGKYLVDKAIVPSISYTTNQIKIRKFPLYYKFSIDGERAWLRSSEIHNGEENFYKTNANTSIKLTSPYRITKKITLTSEVGIKTYWQDYSDKDENITYPSRDDVYRWTYNTTLNLNIRSLNFFNHQFSYYFEQQPDKKHDDYRGVIVDKLKTAQSIYLDKLTMRVWTGLDIRRKIGEKIINFSKRFDGIISEIDYNPYKFLNIYYKNNYNVSYKKPNSIVLDSSIKIKKTSYLKNGISYERLTPNRLMLFTEVGFRPTTNWQIAYKMQSSFSYDFTDYKNNLQNCSYYERVINVYRDLHCWEVNFLYLDRIPIESGDKNCREFWFKIQTKPDIINKKSDTLEMEKERKWYPWR
ncbi:MAG: hypothetical protein ABID79_01675 [Elusimicrobiota bacterium]